MIENNKQKSVRRILPLLLGVILSVMTAIVAFAAETITLTAANVTEWPTAEGEMFVGQILGEHITIVGGEVRYDADGDGVLEDTEIVPGHFEHFNATLSISLASEASKANIKFVPDDPMYSGFNKLMSTDVTFVVKKTTAVLKDDANPPVASKIKEGQTLSESTISGGTMKNPYNEKLNLSSKVWTWVDPTQVITESGEYLAKWEGDSRAYETVTAYIYVEVETDQKATTLKTMPVVNFDYNPKLTWGTYEFTGASAVITNTDTEVPGTFSIIDSWAHIVPGAGTYEVDMVFTPDDTENYIGFTTSVPVTINTVPIAFIDSEGNYVVDGFEFEVNPGTSMSAVEAYLKAYLNYPPQSVIGVEDRNSNAQNGRTYKLTVIHDNPNYVGSELYFTVVFKEVEFTPTIRIAGKNKIIVDCGEYRPAGTFTITVNGEVIGEVKRGHMFDCVIETDEGGTFDVVAKYNPTENDYFIVSDATLSRTVNPKRNLTTGSGMVFTVNGSKTFNEIRTGDVIEIECQMPDFALFVIKDGSGKAVTLDGVDLTNKKITFTMPDHDISVSAKTNAMLEREEAIAGCDHICHSGNGIFQMLWKLLSFFFRLFDVQQYCDCGITHYDAPIFG